jgi:hypothetical protein
MLKETVPRDFQGFFHESVSPKPLSILLVPFRIFSKIRGDTVCAAQGAPPESLTPVANGKIRKVMNVRLPSSVMGQVRTFFQCLKWTRILVGTSFQYLEPGFRLGPSEMDYRNLVVTSFQYHEPGFKLGPSSSVLNGPGFWYRVFLPVL